MAAFASALVAAAFHEKAGRSVPSPRRSNGICRSLVSQLSGSDLLAPGKVPFARPGTATTSHSAPLAIWIVRIWTTLASISGVPAFSPPSSSLAISSHCKKDESDPPLRTNLAASSIKRSRWRRPCVPPSRNITSLSRLRYRSISTIRSVIGPDARERRRRRSAAKLVRRCRPTWVNNFLSHFSISSSASIALPIN